MNDEKKTTISEVRAVPAPVWTLEITDDAGWRREQIAEGEQSTLGSGSAAQIRVADPAVSSRHCTVAVERGRLVLVDLGSRNGVRISGSRISHAMFDAPGHFVVGRAIVTFEPHCPADEDEDVLGQAPLPGVVGTSISMRRVAREVRRLAPLRAPVLIRGETGTGKELIADALHRFSPRALKPFVPLNMGALPGELADAELFGHERGAFTGAIGARPGAFEQARGGTLFLDEIAELPLASQSKLLRVLEMGEIRAIGATSTKRVEVRVVAATWAPLDERVEEGEFREDLYHRLAVLAITLPPLRDRRGDIGALALALLHAQENEVGERQLTPGALSQLAGHRWPGNVRELRNVLLRAGIFAQGRFIHADHVRRAILGVSSDVGPRSTRAPTGDRKSQARAALAAHGSVSGAAKALGVARSTLRMWAK